VLVGAQPGLLWGEPKAEDAAGPDFKEVYDLVRAHLAGMSEAQLNQAAVQPLILGLGLWSVPSHTPSAWRAQIERAGTSRSPSGTRMNT
jgi:hypothetical protein